MFDYFCNTCGYEFQSNLMEHSMQGLLNDIQCPRCRCYDIYPKTETGYEKAFENYCNYEFIIN